MILHSGGSAGLGGLGRSDRRGLAIWFAFAVVAVAVRGVRWDEAYEHAQILSGQVPYPADHPLYRYVHNGFSAQTYFSAAVVWLAPGPWILCSLRNVLFVMTSALPAYLFAGRLAGDPLWGHVGALLSLSGIFVEFDSSYPITVWPTTFTNGYLGGGYMLLTLFLLLTHRLRSGLLFLGLAPAIHIGQLPSILAVSLLFLVWNLWRGDRARVWAAIPWGLAGLALCVVFAGVMRVYHVPAAEASAAPSASAVESVWRGYTAYVDPHRKFPLGNAHIAAVAALLLSSGAARAVDRSEPLWNWLCLYTASVTATVWGIMAVHGYMGQEIPFPLIGWMPYRLLNLVLPILLATIIGVLASPALGGNGSYRVGPWILSGALLFGFGVLVMREVIGVAIVNRYLASGEFLLLFLIGAAYVRLARRLAPDRRFSLVWQGSVVAAFIALAAYHHLGAAAFALGAIGTTLIETRRENSLPMFPRWATAIAAVLAAFGLLYGQFQSREHLLRSDSDRQIAHYLAGRGESDAILLARPFEFLLQARTNHPVLVEAATASLMSYLPELGPEIQHTYQDIYGIRFDRPRDATDPPQNWQDVWTARSADDWHALASKYGFDYIVAPAATQLNLNEAVRDESVVLYRAR